MERISGYLIFCRGREVRDRADSFIRVHDRRQEAPAFEPSDAPALRRAQGSSVSAVWGERVVRIAAPGTAKHFRQQAS